MCIQHRWPAIAPGSRPGLGCIDPSEPSTVPPAMLLAAVDGGMSFNLGMAVRSSLAGATNIRKILSTTNQRNKRQTDMRNEGLPSRMPGIAIRAFAGRVRVRQSTLLAGLNSRCATLGGQQPVVSAGHCLLEWTKCRLILAEKRPRILPRSGRHWFKGRDAFTTRLGPSPNQVLQDPAKSPA